MHDFSRIQASSLSSEIFLPIQAFPECGGIASFMGTVRNHHQGKAVQALCYSAYQPLAEKMIREIEQQIEQQHQVSYARVIHRIGHLAIGESAIIAMVYAGHRREAFAACEDLIERVKHQVTVFKEEFYLDGSSQFVEGCCIRRDHVVQQACDTHKEIV